MYKLSSEGSRPRFAIFRWFAFFRAGKSANRSNKIVLVEKLRRNG